MLLFTLGCYFLKNAHHQNNTGKKKRGRVVEIIILVFYLYKKNEGFLHTAKRNTRKAGFNATIELALLLNTKRVLANETKVKPILKETLTRRLR